MGEGAVFGGGESVSLEEISDIGEYNGAVVYISRVPSAETHIASKDRESCGILRGAPQFAIANKLTSGEKISFELLNITWSGIFVEDSSLKGVIALLYLSEREAMECMYGYAYQRVKIIKS